MGRRGRKTERSTPDAATRCPLWVKNGIRGVAAGCLLCPGERTSSGCLGITGKCQKEDLASIIAIQSPRWRIAALIAAKLLRSPQIDHHQIFCWQLYGKLRRLCATEDAIHIAGRATEIYLGSQLRRKANRYLWR